MPRYYTKVRAIIEDFLDSMEVLMEVDTSPWKSPLRAYDSMRHCIRDCKDERFREVQVIKHGDVLILRKREWEG